MTVGQLFDTLAVRLPSDLAGGRNVVLHVTLTDRESDAQWTIEISNRAMSSIAGLRGNPDVALSMEFDHLVGLAANELTVADVLAVAESTGDTSAFEFAFGNLDSFFSGFAIVEP